MIFFLQMAVILAVSRTCGWAVSRWLRQPPVIGEMIAGVLLGPTLLGATWPAAQAQLFPVDSMPLLNTVAQLGIGLYMFIVGLTFGSGDLKAQVPRATTVSLAGIAVPFAFAYVGTPWLMQVPGLFGAGVSRFDATLFFGAAVAITAFPVLARIIHDRRLGGTQLATLALSAAAIGDAVAWCVLAIVLASLAADASVAVIAIVGGFAFSAALILWGPRLLAPLGRMAERQQAAGQPLGSGLLALALIAFTLAAFTADRIGLHAVFGGFLIGTAMPRGVFAERVKAALEPFTLAFLLPVFFAYSGLHTQFAIVADADLAWIALAVLGLSIVAKLVACWAAARATGMENRAALGLGALMNARGLTELVIINIGLSAGIIGPPLFSMLVLMAIVTTLMASPLFEFFYGRGARVRGELPGLDDRS